MLASPRERKRSKFNKTGQDKKGQPTFLLIILYICIRCIRKINGKIGRYEKKDGGIQKDMPIRRGNNFT